MQALNGVPAVTGKARIVLSGPNMNQVGALMVFRDAIESLAAEYADRFDIVALVHKKSLFDVPGVTFLEFPETKTSWFKRLRFEYWDCRALSKELDAYLWIGMHDTSPIVHAKVQAVYCHNPTAFYRFRLSESLLDWRFGMFTLFYRFLYGLNIKANDFVVVQQDWLRDGFMSRYGISSVVVARPSVEHLVIPVAPAANDSELPYRFFYPSYPRPYKNMDQVLEASRILERSGFNRFEVWLTINGTETRYSKKLFREYGDLTTVRWLGLLPREEVLARYAEAECLLFPSRLETWGMPITEFKPTGKPILAADLPYAYETVGTYGKAAFFDTSSPARLAECMRQAALGEPIFHAVEERPIAAPVSHNWHELWQILLASS